MLKGVFFTAPILFLFGCAALLPSKTKTTTAPWKNYEVAKKLFDTVEPYKTSLDDLKKLSFDPQKVPNTRFLNALTIRNMFLNNLVIGMKDLPEGIRDCLGDFENCRGFEFKLSDIKDLAIGNFYLRVFKFKKENLVTGTDVTFQFFLKGNIIVYKLFDGVPDTNKLNIERSPLGPVQEPFDFVIQHAPKPF